MNGGFVKTFYWLKKIIIVKKKITTKCFTVKDNNCEAIISSKEQSFRRIFVTSRGGRANFFKSPQILTFLDSFRYRKSENFLGFPVANRRSAYQTNYLKGPKHDQVEIGFFYTNQTHMVR
jgi:hypothetical protein